MKINNLTVVVREVGERTKELCLQLLSEEVEEKAIFTVHETPFRKAHKKSLEVGASQDSEWTAIVDADCLVRAGSLTDALEETGKVSDDTFFVHTKMLDKFFGGTRYGGVKLYRTSMLPQLISCVPEGTNVKRPETQTNKAMVKLGYKWHLSNHVCCMHDFEQYYSDILRKGYTHGKKSTEFTEALLPYWKRAAESDTDFRVLLAGYDLAKQSEKPLALDVDEVSDEVPEVLAKLGIAEKEKLSLANFSTQTISDHLSQFNPPLEYYKVNSMLENNLPGQKPGIFAKLNRLLRQP